MAHPPRLTRSSSRCPRLGHWGICGTQQGEEGTGSRTTNGFPLGAFSRGYPAGITQQPDLPRHGLAPHLAGTATGPSRAASLCNSANKAPHAVQPACPDLRSSWLRGGCSQAGSSHSSSTQLSTRPGSGGLVRTPFPASCSLL